MFVLVVMVLSEKGYLNVPVLFLLIDETSISII